MAGRGHVPHAFERRIVQAPGMMRHGPFPAGPRPLDPLPPSDRLENKIAAQAAEMERLVGDNRRLAASHVALREDLIASQQDIQRLKAHIRSIQTESDIQIRVLLDKIAKMEANIRAGENVEKDLQQARLEAQNLVKARQELIAEIQHASKELQKVHLEVKSLPDLHSELDKLRQEHNRLRATYEYEKGLNIDQVEQMKARENNLIDMAREVEKLRAEVLNAENRVHAPNPYTGGYMNPNASCPSPMQGVGYYVDAYGRPLIQMGVGPAGEGVVPYGIGNGAAATGEVGGAAVPGAGGGAVVWGGVSYNPSATPR